MILFKDEFATKSFEGFFFTIYIKGAFKYHITPREGEGEEISPMCDKNIITLNLGDFCTKNYENAIKIREMFK